MVFITSMNITTNIYHDINTMALQEERHVSKSKGCRSDSSSFERFEEGICVSPTAKRIAALIWHSLPTSKQGSWHLRYIFPLLSHSSFISHVSSWLPVPR